MPFDPPFSGYIQPPGVPPDPTGECWRGPPGPQGPPGPSGNMDAAPMDGFAYGLVNAYWNKVLPLSGGVLTGTLTLAGPPASALGAATRDYVDTKVAGAGGAVSSVAGKTGVVTLTHTDITDWTSATATFLTTAVTSFNTRGGAVSLTGGDVTTALGYTPYNTTNPSNYQTGTQVSSAVSASVANYVPLSQRAKANGVATLDASGVIPTSQLPGTVTGTLNYRGGWNAATNTPAATSGAHMGGIVQAAGNYWVVTVAATTAAIDGITTWTAGDWISSNGTTWEKVQTSTSPYLPLTGGAVSGSTTFGATIGVTGAATLSGNTTVGGTLAVAGTVSGAGITALLSPYALKTAVPAASATLPVMDGTATVGIATTWAHGDHSHPVDTSRYAASNPAGYQTAAQVSAAIPAASSTTPAMDGAAAVGGGTTWARADHVHPSDTTRLSLAAGGTVTGALTAPISTSTAIATSSTTARTMAARFADVANVRDFGAVANGTTDDLPAINAAIAAVAAAGGTVFFPSGVYAISGPIKITAPDVTLRGSGAGNWMFGFQGNKGTTLLYTGANNVDAIIDISPVVPSGQFIWCVNVRDMNLDCANHMSNGIIAESLCNSEFANLNILQPTGNGLYLAAATTTSVGFTMRCNFRNINIAGTTATNGVLLDGQPGGSTNVGGCSLNYFENVQVIHHNGDAFHLVNTDSNLFMHCGASRDSGGTGNGLVFGSSSDGSGRRSENDRFIAFICAATPTGTASQIWAQGGTSPSINNYVEYSQMDGPPNVRVDFGATLYYYTLGSYVSGAIPQTLMPGIYGLDAAAGSITAPTRLEVQGGQNNGNVLINIAGGISPGGGANASLPQFTLPVLPFTVAVASLPVMAANNTGCMAFATNGRRPSEGVGAGTGVPVYWSGGAWHSVIDGAAVAA